MSDREISIKKSLEKLLLLQNTDKTRGLGTLSEEGGIITISYPRNDICSFGNITNFMNVLNIAIPESEKWKVFNEKISDSKANDTIDLVIKPDYKKPLLTYLDAAIKTTEKDISDKEEILNKIEARSIKLPESVEKVKAYLTQKIFSETGGSKVTVNYQPADEKQRGAFIISLDNQRGKNSNFLEKLNSFLPANAVHMPDDSNDRINYRIESRPEFLAAHFDFKDHENFSSIKNPSLSR